MLSSHLCVSFEGILIATDLMTKLFYEFLISSHLRYVSHVSFPSSRLRVLGICVFVSGFSNQPEFLDFLFV